MGITITLDASIHQARRKNGGQRLPPDCSLLFKPASIMRRAIVLQRTNG